MDKLDEICGGLDCFYANAVSRILLDPTDPPELVEEPLEKSIRLRASTKCAFVNKAVREYRAKLVSGGGDPPVLILDTLNIVEEHNGKLGAKKLLERVRLEMSRRRQVGMPWAP